MAIARAQRDYGWIVTGTAASIVSAIVLSTCGWIENRNAVGPQNGPSQWLWGRRAARKRTFSARHTLAGYAIHHASSLLWSGIHQAVFARRRRQLQLSSHLMQGAATAALACAVDYQLTPRRFQPGFEQQVCRTSLFFVYAGFGIALGLTTHLLARGCDRAQR